jgi:hypothetical protein
VIPHVDDITTNTPTHPAKPRVSLDNTTVITHTGKNNDLLDLDFWIYYIHTLLFIGNQICLQWPPSREMYYTILPEDFSAILRWI